MSVSFGFCWCFPHNTGLLWPAFLFSLNSQKSEYCRSVIWQLYLEASWFFLDLFVPLHGSSVLEQRPCSHPPRVGGQTGAMLPQIHWIYTTKPMHWYFHCLVQLWRIQAGTFHFSGGDLGLFIRCALALMHQSRDALQSVLQRRTCTCFTCLCPATDASNAVRSLHEFHCLFH